MGIADWWCPVGHIFSVKNIPSNFISRGSSFLETEGQTEEQIEEKLKLSNKCTPFSLQIYETIYSESHWVGHQFRFNY